MRIPKRPTEPREYESSFGVKFTVRPLTVSEYDEVTNLIVEGKRASALRLACNYGLKGWSLEDEFNRSNVAILEPSWAYELGGEILTISTLSDTEKN